MFKNKQGIREKILDVSLTNCFVSEITLAELFYGAAKNGREEHFKDVEMVIRMFKVLPVYPCLRLYGGMKAELEAKGMRIDEFDLLSNVGYGKEVLSKKERTKKGLESVLKLGYSETQIEIIEEIFNIYERKGITELENIKLLDGKEFRKFGGLIPVINTFEGKEKYLKLIKNIKQGLYD